MREVLTPAEVAALLQIHVKTVYRLTRLGLLPGSRIGHRWRFSRDEILALLASPPDPLGPLARPDAPRAARDAKDRQARARNLPPGRGSERP